jgi:hypothetical protein
MNFSVIPAILLIALLIIVIVTSIRLKLYCWHLWQEAPCGSTDVVTLRQEVRDKYEGKYARNLQITYMGVRAQCVKCKKVKWVKREERKYLTI